MQYIVPPPIKMSAEEFRRLATGTIDKSFRVGDLVVPILSPVDSEDTNPATLKRYLLVNKGPLRIRQVNNRAGRVSFEDENGSFDMAFFRSNESQK